jgi:hypothetical protein
MVIEIELLEIPSFVGPVAHDMEFGLCIARRRLMD